jgi:hypothetical protein
MDKVLLAVASSAKVPAEAIRVGREEQVMEHAVAFLLALVLALATMLLASLLAQSEDKRGKSPDRWRQELYEQVNLLGGNIGTVDDQAARCPYADGRANAYKALGEARSCHQKALVALAANDLGEANQSILAGHAHVELARSFASAGAGPSSACYRR